MTTEYRTRNTSPTDKMPRIDDREVLSGAAMTRVERVEAGAGANFKNIKGGKDLIAESFHEKRTATPIDELCLCWRARVVYPLT